MQRDEAREERTGQLLDNREEGIAWRIGFVLDVEQVSTRNIITRNTANNAEKTGIGITD
jgi:hypothetical protein